MAVANRRNIDRTLKWSAVAFAIGFGIHGLDHLRRGMSASPMAIMAGGTAEAVLVVVASVMVLTGRYRAPEAAIGIGFGSATVFTYAHLLPTVWSDFQARARSPVDHAPVPDAAVRPDPIR